MATFMHKKTSTLNANHASVNACFLFTDHCAISGFEFTTDLATKNDATAKIIVIKSPMRTPLFYGKNTPLIINKKITVYTYFLLKKYK